MRENPISKTGLLDLIEQLPINITGIEIGSYAGESTELFLRSGKFKMLYCVDYWKPGHYENRATGEAQFDRMINHYTNAEKCKMNCNDIVERFKDIQIDFIYIDGSHEFEQIKKDIQNSLILLNGCGIIAGHDWHKETPDVEKAVMEMIGKPDMMFADSSWLIFYPNNITPTFK